MSEDRDRKVAEALVAQGKIGAAQVAMAMERAQSEGTSLVAAMIQAGYVTAADVASVADSIAPEPVAAAPGPAGPPRPNNSGATPAPRTLRPRRASLASYQVDPEALRDVPKVMAQEYKLLPLQISEDRILVAMADQTDVFAMDAIRDRTGRRVEAVEVDEEELIPAIDQYYVNQTQAMVNMAAGTKELDTSLADYEDLGVGVDQSLMDMMDSGLVVEIVKAILRDAIRLRASDIHVEPRHEGVQVRFRVDGRLMTATNLDRDMQRFVISRLKILAECDISETRLPQDGRFATTVDGRVIDIRMSTLPTFWGEKVVLRILDRSSALVSLSQLGFSPEMLRDYERLIRSPQGMILVTGPTGSGKSTTLYSSLHAINDETRNITTVEDPIEYEVDGLNQTSVVPRIELSFARALRHILRQDPDVILVGEVRDYETAEMAFRAALTGHLVLTTLHTNDAPSAATRLVDLGIAPYMISASVIGVLAQRLVRRICTRCRETCMPTDVELERLQLPAEQAKKIQFHKGRGCQRCRNTGYSGRIALYELMVMTNELRDAISGGATASQLRQMAVKAGMRSLKYDGLLKINQGLTTAQEVISVMFASDTA